MFSLCSNFVDKKRKEKLLVFACVLVFIVSFFVAKSALAADPIVITGRDDPNRNSTRPCIGYNLVDMPKGEYNGKSLCTCESDGGVCTGMLVDTKDECSKTSQLMKDQMITYKTQFNICYFKGNDNQSQIANTGTKVDSSQRNQNITKGVNPAAVGEGVASVFSGLIQNELYTAIKAVLYSVLQLFGWLLGVAGILFAWVVDPSVMSGNAGLFNKAAVRDIWIMVRDFLNLFFILVLLFSAFSTIFQVSKYHISKIWLNVLLNALLVNFSFPIARLVIDLSNVIMYYFLNNMFTGVAAKSGSSIMANIANFSALAGIVTPKDYAAADMTYLIASTIFVFILAITLLVLAALFVVRLVMLTVLIMFSPIGFVGYIFPGSKGYADKWWDSLFQYAFFGPIMTFIMAVAIKIMETLKNDNMGQVIRQASNNAVNPKQGEWLGEVAFFVIPISILWIGMGYAQSAKIIGAKAIIGRAEKFSNWAKSLPGRGADMAWKATGIPGGVKQAKDHYGKRGVRLFPGVNRRFFGSDQTASTSGWVASKLGAPVDYKTADGLANERAKERKGVMDFDSMGKRTAADLDDEFRRATLDNKLAMANGLAEKGKATAAMTAWMAQNKENFGLAKEGFDKVKEKSPHLALAHLLDKNGDPDKKAREKMVKKFKTEDLDDKILADVEFMKMYIDAGKMDKKAVDGLTDTEKTVYGDTVNNIMTDMAAAHAADPTNPNNPSIIDVSNDTVKNVQVQHLALKGELHSSLEDQFDANGNNVTPANVVAAREKIFRKLNKDTAAKLKTETVDMYKNEIAKSIDKGKAGEVIRAIPNENDRKKIVMEMLSDPQLAPVMAPVIRRDPYLNSLR